MIMNLRQILINCLEKAYWQQDATKKCKNRHFTQFLSMFINTGTSTESSPYVLIE